MEDDLDDIASGGEEQVPWLERFYFGEHRPGAVRPTKAAGHSLAVDGSHGLKDAVSLHLDEIDAREVNSIPLATDAEGREIVIHVGRYGPYLQRGEDRAAGAGRPGARRAHLGTGRGASWSTPPPIACLAPIR